MPRKYNQHLWTVYTEVHGRHRHQHCLDRLLQHQRQCHQQAKHLHHTKCSDKHNRRWQEPSTTPQDEQQTKQKKTTEPSHWLHSQHIRRCQHSHLHHQQEKRKIRTHWQATAHSRTTSTATERRTTTDFQNKRQHKD